MKKKSKNQLFEEHQQWGHKKMDVKHVGAAPPAVDKCTTTLACRLVKACYEIVTGFSRMASRCRLEVKKSKIKEGGQGETQEDMGECNDGRESCHRRMDYTIKLG